MSLESEVGSGRRGDNGSGMRRNFHMMLIKQLKLLTILDDDLCHSLVAKRYRLIEPCIRLFRPLGEANRFCSRIGRSRPRDLEYD